MPARAFGRISDLFSSVRFGIWLLAILFVYMTIGSAGVIYPTHPNLLHPDAWTHAQLRQWRPFEMTEFEWFHWWPFDLLMALIAANMAWTTLRRIPLRVVNLGVWMIHAGILVLIAGSVWYFGTKVEGDTPVARRAIVVRATAADGTAGKGRVVAMPGTETAFKAGGENWRVQVAQIDPNWELRTGGSAGERAYSVMLMVEGPRGRFMRQVIAGRPELSEDLVLTDDPKQPLQRAVKAKGKAIVETAFEAVAEYESQPWFYLKNDLNKSWALYLRRPGESAWVERPIRGLPLYNDYVPADGLAFTADGERVTVDPLSVDIPAVAANDPFPALTLKATGYLRYAFERTRLAKGGPDAPLNPAAKVVVQAEGGPTSEQQLLAFDETRNASDLIAFRWADTREALEAMARSSRLAFMIDGQTAELTAEQWGKAGSEAFTPIGPPEAGLQVRVVAVQENLKLAGGRVSVAIIDLRTPNGDVRRWAFDRPELNRDMKPGDNPDPKAPANTMLPSVATRFVPGLAQSPITLVAGPDPAQLTLIDGAEGSVRSRQLVVGTPLDLGKGLTLKVSEYLPRAIVESRPFIVPQRQRMKDAREQFSMALVQSPDGRAAWLPYHDCVFDRPEEVIRRRDLRPTLLTLTDGTQVELLFSRQRLPLPSPVALESFELAAHVGGFTGETTTIRDYTSLVRFADGKGAWGEPMRLSVNAPVEHGGLSYFQAQWDPPDDGGGATAPSLGLNYTVLGVGSRHGVGVQLVGCIIAVLGMLYAFYVKPVIKRRALLKQKAAARSGAMAIAAALLAAAFLSPTARAADATVAPTSMQQIDLMPLERSAVMNEGRIKSLGSFAFGYTQQITGSKSLRGGEPPMKQSPLFTLLDLMLRPDAYTDADAIYVKNREVRVRIAQALLATDPSLAARMDGFDSHGLIAADLLWSTDANGWRPEIAPVMQQMEGDLIRSAKQVDQIRGAIMLMQPAQIAGRLRMVPVEASDKPWQTLDQATGPVADAWRNLQASWKAGDAVATQNSVNALAAALRTAGGAALPSESRLEWEAWYFRSGQMTWVWFVYFGAVALLLLGFSWKWPTALRLGLAVFAAAFLLQTAAVGLRWFVSDRWPNSNMFEAVTTASWMGAALAAIAEALFRRLPVRGLFALGASVGCMVALMACALLPAQLNPAIGNMMPVLHDVWLYIHTNVIIFSYALIFMAAVTAAMYLAWRWAGGAAVHARVGGAGEMIALATGDGAAAATAPGRLGEILDGVTMTLMELSFVLLWAGIAMGAIWADHSWGRPWGWDPKEVFALNTFVVFALLVHVRWRSKDKGLWTAGLAVVGAGVMLFNWIVINFVITGLHSYA